MTKLISEIVVENRLRIDKDIDANFVDSIREHGLIEPIILSELPDGRVRLLAGERRLLACQAAGHKELHHGVTYDPLKPGYLLGKELPPEKLILLELEENLKRKEMRWQERCIGIAAYHRACKRTNNLAGISWGFRETATLLGVKGHSNVHMAIILADELVANPNSPLHACSTMSEAWGKIIERQQNEINAELARRQQVETLKGLLEEEKFNDVQSVGDIEVNLDANLLALRQRASGKGYLELNENEQRSLYLSNASNPPDQFEAYREQRIAFLQQQEDVVWLSRILHHGDSIEFMNREENEARFNHIITDIPYAIDMSMLEQENTGMDVSSTAKEHDVEYNLELIKAFFPAAYKCTNDSAFVITWCDTMLFRWMHDLAVEAGFKVQRWPYYWCKPHAGNQAAQYNFTKATEIAIVCRKPSATLVEKGQRNWIEAAHDELSESINHPFSKPFAIWETLINTVSIKGQVILEPFAGRGSGVISMLRLDRFVIGVELNQDHYNSLLENVKTQHFLKLNPNLKFK